MTKDDELMVVARQKYLNTVKLVAKNLTSIEQNALDGTLKQVLLLAVFEVCPSSCHIVCEADILQVVDCEPQRSNVWGVHIDGALALLKLIRSDPFRHQPSTRLHLQLCFAFVSSQYILFE